MNINRTVHNLKKNGFIVYTAKTIIEAKTIVLDQILPAIQPKSISYGDSMTVEETHILDALRDDGTIDLIEPIVDGIFDVTYEQSRRGLLTDLFFSGANAITEKGEIVNLDMLGNRIAGTIFGPKNVILIAGTNKIARNIDQAQKKIKRISAPLNAKRNTDLKIPCQSTGICSDCNSPDRICNYWSIIDKCFPVGKIRIVLIQEPIGL